MLCPCGTSDFKMNRELARDILKAVQNATNHFVASKTAKVGSTIRLTHPVGKAIFAQALTPLSGSCLVFEQNGQWFAVAGAERRQTNSTTVVSRRSRPRGKTSTEFEVAYLFTETVDDDSQLPFVYTVYGLNTTKMVCERKPLNRRESAYATPEDCKNFSTYSTLDAPYDDYFKRFIYRTNNMGFSGGSEFDIYAYDGDNSDALSRLDAFVNNRLNDFSSSFKNGSPTPDVYENENYLVVASGNILIRLVYQRFVEGGTALQYLIVSYRMDISQAVGTRYCKSNNSYTDYQGNQIYSGQINFPLPHTTDQILAFAEGTVDGRLNIPNTNNFNALNPTLSVSLNCSHANLSYLATEAEMLPYRSIYGELFDYTTNNESINFGGTGTILGSELEASGLSISTTGSGTVPSSVEFFTAYYSGAPRNGETFSYAGFLPVNFGRSYIVSDDFSTRLLGASAYQEYKTIETTGKRVFYLQRKNEQPIKLLELPKQEATETLISSSLNGFNIILKAGVKQETGYPYNTDGFYRVYLIEVLTNSRIPSIEIYNILDNDVIPIPNNNWLKLYYTFQHKYLVEIYADAALNAPDSLTLASTFPYWASPSVVDYFASKLKNVTGYLYSNINTFDSGKTLFYFELTDLMDTDPIVYIEPLPEPIFINAGTIGYLSDRNQKHLVSAFFTGRFTNARLWKVSRLPDSEQVPGELLQYSAPQALGARLYPLNIGLDLATSTVEEIESAIERHVMVAIIPYRGVVTKKTFVSQEIVEFPLTEFTTD